MQEIIQKATTPPEVALIQEYLDVADDSARQQFLDAHQAELTAEFMEMLGSISAQIQASGDKELADRAMAANRQALRYVMRRNMQA